MWPLLKCFQGYQQRRQQSVKVRVTEHRITHRWFFATPLPGSALPLERGPQCSSPPSSPYTRTYLDNVPQKYVLVSCVSQFSSVSQSCPTLRDPKDCSTPGFPIHQQTPELAQTHIHQVGDAIQPISSSVVLFSSCLQTFPASGSFPMSQFLL